MKKFLLVLLFLSIFSQCSSDYSKQVRSLIRKQDYEKAYQVLRDNKPADSLDVQYHLLNVEFRCKAPGKYNRSEVLQSESILKNHGVDVQYDIRQQMLFDTCMAYKFHLGRILNCLMFLSGDIRHAYEKLMIYSLDHPDPWIRQEAIEEVGGFVRRDSTGLILLINSSLRDSTSAAVRLAAAEVLVKTFNIDNGFKTVKKAIKDSTSTPEVAAQCLDILGYMTKKGTENLIKQHLNSDNQLVRIYAVGAWAQHGKKADISLLINKIKKRDKVWLKASLHNIVKLEIGEIPFSFKGFLDDPDAGIRRLALDGLARYEKTQAAQMILEKYSSEPDIEVRAHMVETLGRIRDIRAAPYLISLFNDPSEMIQNKVIFTLGNIGEHVIPIVIDSLNSPTANIKQNCIVFLAYAKSVSASQALFRIFLDKDTNMGRLAADAMYSIRDSSMVDTLIHHLSDPRQFVAMQSIRILGEIGHQKALEALKAIKGKPEKEFQAKAAVQKIEKRNQERLKITRRKAREMVNKKFGWGAKSLNKGISRAKDVISE